MNGGDLLLVSLFIAAKLGTILADFQMKRVVFLFVVAGIESDIFYTSMFEILGVLLYNISGCTNLP